MSPSGRGDIHRVWLAPATDTTHRCQALLISAETAIGGAAEPTTVVGAPRTILRVRGRSDRGSDEQNAKQKKRSFHDHSFRSTLGRATSNRQLSSRLDDCKVFTRRFYLAARSESARLRKEQVKRQSPELKHPSRRQLRRVTVVCSQGSIAADAPATIWSTLAGRPRWTIRPPSATGRLPHERRDVLYLRMQSRGTACLNLRACRNHGHRDYEGSNDQCGRPWLQHSCPPKAAKPDGATRQGHGLVASPSPTRSMMHSLRQG